MSVKDFIKKSVLENFSPYNVPQMAAALLAAVLLGALIYWVYQRFYAGVLFSRSFAMTLVGMSVLTCMVTLAISTNVVISLGTVSYTHPRAHETDSYLVCRLLLEKKKCRPAMTC